MRLNAIRCLPCKGAGPVTSSDLGKKGKKEGGPGSWGLGQLGQLGNGEGGPTNYLWGLERMWTGVIV